MTTTLLLLSCALLLFCGMRAFTLPMESYGGLNANGRPAVPLDFVHWPLYSSVGINAAVLPREVSFFTYVRGQTVAGAGGATITANGVHCNNLLANAIPKPKTFMCTGIRLLLSPLDHASGAPAVSSVMGAGAAVAAANVDQQTDFVFISQSTWFELRQGEVLEVEGPTYLMPGNSGIGGKSATTLIADTDSIQTRVALCTQGVGWSLKRRPFVLWNQQHFEAKLGCDWATRPTITQERLLYCVLEGIMGREYQG